MEEIITVISVREYDSSKYVRQEHRKYLGVDVRGVSLLVLGFDSNNQKVSFFTPVVYVGTDIVNDFKQSLNKNTGNFFKVENNKVVPVISHGDIIKISYKKQEITNYGQRRLRIVRLEEIR